MSVSSIAKSQAIMRDLTDRLQKKLPTSTFTSAVDVYGPQLLITMPGSGQVMAIRIENEQSNFTDIIGSPQVVYAPLKAQVIEEASATAGVSLMLLVNRLAVDLELARMGLKQERWMNANGTLPTLAQFQSGGSTPSPTVTGSTLIASLPFDMYWPLSGQ